MGSAQQDLGRASGGALLFGLPLLMTMEMWELAVTMQPLRVAILVAAAIILLIELARLSGFTDGSGGGVGDRIVDAGVAIAVGAVIAATMLSLVGVVDLSGGWHPAALRVALGTVPCSIGAMFARSQLATEEGEGVRKDQVGGYADEVVLMVTGGLITAFNIAPTEEVALISYQSGSVRITLLMLASVASMHALVYFIGVPGSHRGEGSPIGTFLRYTIVGYIAVLLVMAFLLWCFGRADDVGGPVLARQVVVLGFPGAVGAAIARLIL